MTLAVVLLAAGHGTRMHSKYQKVLHHVGGRPMVEHSFRAAVAVADVAPVVVIGAGEDGVARLLGDRATCVTQRERLGTGHATLLARAALAERADQVLVTYGDMPLLRATTLEELARRQAARGAAVVLLTVAGDPASSYGRVLRDTAGQVTEICEVANARQRADGEAILNLREHNVGVYCFDAAFLWAAIERLPLRQARGGQEYYLTDMVELAVAENRPVEAVPIDDPEEALGAGTRAELIAVDRAFRRRACRRWLDHGVTIIDPHSTYIDPDVVIGQDTIVWPNTYLQGRTAVGADCVIGPGAILRDALVGSGCRIEQAVVEGATVGDNERVPPFSYLAADRGAVP